MQRIETWDEEATQKQFSEPVGKSRLGGLPETDARWKARARCWRAGIEQAIGNLKFEMEGKRPRRMEIRFVVATDSRARIEGKGPRRRGFDSSWLPIQGQEQRVSSRSEWA
jgi:hypothetical protein